MLPVIYEALICILHSHIFSGLNNAMQLSKAALIRIKKKTPKIVNFPRIYVFAQNCQNLFLTPTKTAKNVSYPYKIERKYFVPLHILIYQYTKNQKWTEP